jgi:hypothetical protein
LARMHKRVTFHVITISDTVIITAASKLAPAQLLRHIAADLEGIYRVALAHGVIFRGAVSFGDFYRQGTSYVGPAVDEAAEWHTTPNCAGVILTPGAGAVIDKHVRQNKSRAALGLVRLPVPLNGGNVVDCWTLDWYRCWLELDTLEETFLRPPVSIEVAKKLENTLKLCKEMWTQYEGRHPDSGMELPWRGVSDAMFARAEAKQEKIVAKRAIKTAAFKRKMSAFVAGKPAARRLWRAYSAAPLSETLPEANGRLEALFVRLRALGLKTFDIEKEAMVTVRTPRLGN